EVADDQNAGVAFVLKGAHALELHGPADVDVRRRDVDAELDPQRLAASQLALELAHGQHVDGVTSELGDPHQVPKHSVTIARLCSVDGENRRGAGGGFASSVCWPCC